MNAKELINELKKYPEDAIVSFHHDYDCEYVEVTNVKYWAEKDQESMRPKGSKDNLIVLNDF